MTSARARLSRAIYGDDATPAPVLPAPRLTAGEHPELTIALASYNRRDSLRGVLTALAAQSYPLERIEVVVVLDGSSDGSAEMTRALDVPYELRTVEQPQSGLAAARNR